MRFSEQVTETNVAKLPKNLKAFIFRNKEMLRDDEPVYAINWFDTRSRLVYDFYNMLAAKPVLKVGGRPFLKCQIIKRLHGDVDRQRDMLLIVRYPGLKNFGNMLENKFFQLVSLIRSVPLSEDQQAQVVYGVLHYVGAPDELDPRALIASTPDVELQFIGKIGASLAVGKATTSAQHVPCILDGIVILKASNTDSFDGLVASTDFQQLSDQSEHLFFGVYDRVL